ncbi:uncharacterized protein LOC106460275 [Limulus polyphemus]|uniref:Uncharacterized protein LOC106460275 n=1 Tax=Limulus polyphemus TaxID=6850 RepID=A0ABM1SGA2_LIMPO|nr:uncharacterized protein LOC106460275 [Limulus polyphemus]
MAAKPVVIIFFCVILVVFLLGLLIGYYGISSGLTEEQAEKLEMLDRLSLSTYYPYDDAAQRILKDVSPENIKKNLRYLTEQTHLAGTARNNELARYIRDTWKAQGLDKVDLVPYDILLSYPDKDKPNKVHIVDDNERIIFSSSHLEDPTASPKDIIPAFNGYAPRGDVTLQKAELWVLKAIGQNNRAKKLAKQFLSQMNIFISLQNEPWPTLTWTVVLEVHGFGCKQALSWRICLEAHQKWSQIPLAHRKLYTRLGSPQLPTKRTLNQKSKYCSQVLTMHRLPFTLEYPLST